VVSERQAGSHACGSGSPSGQGPVPAVLSATVLLLQDTVDGLEVLLLERHLASDFAGGAFVFPGGKVDATDRGFDPARVRGGDLDVWRAQLGVETHEDALGVLVAAVRETFEEAGVLLATRADGTPLTADDLAGARLREARRRLATRGEPFDWRPVLEAEDLVLDLGALVPWSWWVTPAGQHRRFDTRFLAARLPAGQTAAHDEVETTALVWARPADALAAQARGERVVIYPTRRNLQALDAFGSTAQLFAAAAAGQLDTRRIEPRLVEVDGVTLVQHPDGGAPEPV
jgi:8-oxo-dGTP pyrophosphatase MutT (NUDIX family)